ncbi:glutamate/aspartate:proton symporter GltP [bacterium endosymbiont of Pedicinus badii]|uniref:glutamate/aspartate:proton symporter GltP n=1 Tax=bacterium endosymbiont of Pedicinus badii TaxID=1719126 RepID=UPI0009BA9FC8|nr:glutamate/aspartate:proton symporter GltP [bacterium endosymbiont of Pedicinus badii]OQM34136.1 glutamate:protein symporter [bacterium endosymbiont of Pedicinus badii]
MKRICNISLSWKIFIALVLGSIFGVFLHEQQDIKAWIINNLLFPSGEIFIRMIKMIVIPIVITTLIVGIGKTDGVKKLGSLWIKTILYFEIVTTLAIIFGVILANLFQPGVGIDMSKLEISDISKYRSNIDNLTSSYSIAKTIFAIVPSNIFLSITKGEMLPVIFFSVLFGIGLSSLKSEKKDFLLNFFNSSSKVIFKITNIIMSYSPIGVFALICSTIATFGFSSLLPLIKLIVLVYLSIISFSIFILGFIAYIFGFKIWKIIYILKEELILSFSTASSESVLPKIIEKMKLYGASPSITGFVVPTGYSFNLDGSTLYQSIACIFIAQLYGIELTLMQQIVLIVTLMITSKGIAGVPGMSFVVLLATLGSVGIPLEGLAFIAGIDRILDMARTALNVLGNALAVLVIAKLENQYDQKKSVEYEKNIFKK